ncbi:MAG: hypothetical protein ACUVXJ_11925 [Phycisphaerae bacterium]
MERPLELLTITQTPGGEDWMNLLARVLIEYRQHLYYALGALIGFLILRRI